MADWHWSSHPSCRGLSSSSLFFFLLLALAGIYMFFASKKLRAEEDAEAAIAIKPNGSGAQLTENTTQTDVNPEDRAVRILAVCGNGQGSSMIMKMKW